MERGQNPIEDTLASPVLVVPEHSGVGRQVLGQVAPIAAIFELIQHAVKNLAFCPNGWSGAFLLRQQRFNDCPLFVG